MREHSKFDRKDTNLWETTDQPRVLNEEYKKQWNEQDYVTEHEVNWFNKSVLSILILCAAQILTIEYPSRSLQGFFHSFTNLKGTVYTSFEWFKN